MVKNIGTSRTKTRHKLQKTIRQKGKISLSKYFAAFKVGEMVALCAEPGVTGGMYHPRFHTRAGIIKGKEGSCYKICIKDRGKEKMLLVHPVHLRRLK